MSAPRPGVLARMFDDAATFPPGNLPLPEAVRAHHRHAAAPYGDLVGSFVVGAKDVAGLAPLVADQPPASFPVSLTGSLPTVLDALSRVDDLPTVRLVGVEATLTQGADPAAAVVRLADVAAQRRIPVHLEMPRDERRTRCVAALRGSGCLAKLRTGGVVADLHPDEVELADAVVALVGAGVGFKATAGLHHALRITDPGTGFEQHGFLNLLVATAAARAGAGQDRVAGVLAERQPGPIVETVRRLGPEVRESFRAFGTCSIVQPVEQLIVLGLVPPAYLAKGA